jgi:ribonuclease P protein component
VALRREGRRGRSGAVTATWVPSRDGTTLLAFAVGRHVGGAVTRNRLRRQLRAQFGAMAPTVTPGTYLVAATAAAAGQPFDVLGGQLASALDKAGAR